MLYDEILSIFYDFDDLIENSEIQKIDLSFITILGIECVYNALRPCIRLVLL